MGHGGRGGWTAHHPAFGSRNLPCRWSPSWGRAGALEGSPKPALAPHPPTAHLPDPTPGSGCLPPRPAGARRSPGDRGEATACMAGPRAALAPGGAGWPRSPRLSSSIGPRRGPRDGRKGATLVCEGASQPADGLRLPCLTYSQVDDTSHPASLGGPVSPGDRGRCSGNTWPSDGARHGPANPSPPLLCPRTWPCT